MAQYRARKPIYLNNEGRLIDTGEVFSSEETPDLAWIALTLSPHAAGETPGIARSGKMIVR